MRYIGNGKEKNLPRRQIVKNRSWESVDQNCSLKGKFPKLSWNNSLGHESKVSLHYMSMLAFCGPILKRRVRTRDALMNTMTEKVRAQAEDYNSGAPSHWIIWSLHWSWVSAKCMKGLKNVEKLISRCEGIKPSELRKVINKTDIIFITKKRRHRRQTPNIKMN